MNDGYPDDDAQLMALFGPAFPETIARLNQISKVTEVLESRNERLRSKIDKRIVKRFLDTEKGKDVLLSEDPLPADMIPELREMCMDFRTLIKGEMALEALPDVRKSIIDRARLIGSSIHNIHSGRSERARETASRRYTEEHPLLRDKL
ncbi:MAG: hypothetical protein LBJ20_03735 [Candidatus Methanoplasma sp.]|jgi:hypothetical protein|nr:hypothetical protein [Candidatus Methanoplasma sp.]